MTRRLARRQRREWRAGMKDIFRAAALSQHSESLVIVVGVGKKFRESLIVLVKANVSELIIVLVCPGSCTVSA